MGRKPLSILLVTSLCITSSWAGECTADEKDDDDMAYCAAPKLDDPVACHLDPKCHWSDRQEERDALARVHREAVENGANDCRLGLREELCYGPCVMETDGTTQHCPGNRYELPHKLAPRVQCKEIKCTKKGIHKFHSCTKTTYGYKYLCKSKQLTKSKSLSSLSLSALQFEPRRQSQSLQAKITEARDGHCYLGENLDDELLKIAPKHPGPDYDAITADLKSAGIHEMLPKKYTLEEIKAFKDNDYWKLTEAQIRALLNWQNDNYLAENVRKNWWDFNVKKTYAPIISASLYWATHGEPSEDFLANPPHDLTLYFGMRQQSKSGYLGEGIIFGPVSTSDQVEIGTKFGEGGAVIQINIKKGVAVDGLGGIVNLQWINPEKHEGEWVLWNVNLNICNFYYDGKSHKQPATVDESNPYYVLGQFTGQESEEMLEVKPLTKKLKKVDLVGAYIGDDNPYDYEVYSEMEPNVMQYNDIYSYFMITFIISAIFCMIYISWTAFVAVSCFLFGRLQGIKSNDVDTSQSCV